MKKVFLSLLLIISIAASSQIKISELPTYTGNPSGGWVPISVGSTTKKIDARFFGYGKPDSVLFRGDSLLSFANGIAGFRGKIIHDGNNYVTMFSFDPTSGDLAIGRSGMSAMVINLDGRYLFKDTSSWRGATTRNRFYTALDSLKTYTAFSILGDVVGYGSLNGVSSSLVRGGFGKFWPSASGVDGTNGAVLRWRDTSAGQTGNGYWAWDNNVYATTAYVNGNFAAFEQLVNKATNFTTVNNTKYPSVQAVVNYINSLGYLSAETDPFYTANGVPKTRLLTINGVAHDLTTDPNWTVSGSASLTSGQVGFGVSGVLASSNYLTWDNSIGYLTLGPSAGSEPSLILNSGTGGTGTLRFQQGGINNWIIGKAAPKNFVFNRYDDAGVFQGTAFLLNYANGTAYFKSLDDATGVAKMVTVNNGVLGYQAIPSGGGSTTLSALTDVAISSIANNQLLKYNSTSTKWENWTPNFLTTETDPSAVHLTGNETIQGLKNFQNNSGTNWGNSPFNVAGNLNTYFAGTGDYRGAINLFQQASGNAGQLTVSALTATRQYLFPDKNGTVAMLSDIGAAMVYPGAGVAISTGSAWGSSVTGTSGQLLRRNIANTAYEFFTADYLTGDQSALNILLSTHQYFTNRGNGDTVLTNINDSTIGFKSDSLYVLSSRISITKTITADMRKYGIDVVQSNFSLSSIGGSLNVSQINATGTASSTTYLRGDGSWQTVSGGSSTIATLTDVAITSPANLQVLMYNSTTSKWENKNSAVTNLSSVANNDMLVYNSSTSEWNNKTPTQIGTILGLSTVATTGSHASLSGLTNDDHTQYLLLAGRTGGQTVAGKITFTMSANTTNSIPAITVIGSNATTNGNLMEFYPFNSALLLAKINSVGKAFFPALNITSTPSTYTTGGSKMLVYNQTSSDVEIMDVPSGGSFTDAGYANFDATKKVLIKDTVSGNYYHTQGSAMLVTNLTNNDMLIDSAGYWVNRTTTQIKTLLSLNNVENTAISTWAGSVNITTVGTITTGTWNGTAIADSYIASASVWNGKEPATSLVIVNDANYTIAAGVTHVTVKTLTAGRTITLPTASSNTNRKITIKNGGNGAFNLTTSANIRDNATTVTATISPSHWVTIVSDGTEWWIVESN